MTSLASEHRYTIEKTDCGWDVVDTRTGDSVGTCSTEVDAAKSAQALTNLFRANEIRLGRSALKKDTEARGMFGARERVAELLVDLPPAIHTVKVLDLLKWIPRVGRSQALRILRAFCAELGWRIAEDRRLIDMTARQRTGLADYLRGERIERAA